MNLGKAFIAGVIAGLVMGIIMVIAHSTGMTPMNMPMYQGSMMTGEATSTAWWLGMFSHLIVSGLIALVYAVGFEYIAKKSTWLIGAAFGFVHWIIAGIFLGMMSNIHPLMQDGRLDAPGFFAANFGSVSIVAVLLLHIIYGAIVGAIYTTNEVVADGELDTV